jgi:Domain of unknown function (DUF4956)
MGASQASELPRGGNVAQPRLAWLALFQLAVIAAVVALARVTRGFSGTPTLEDRLSAAGETHLGSAVQSAAWGGRGWLVAVVAMTGALLLMLPIAWAYVATRERRKVDHSVVTTICLLPIAVAAILVIVQDSLAIAFSLAGIAGLVRFRNSLDDTKDAMYVFIAIAVGLGAGVGALEASAALSGLYNLVVIALWKWQTSQPVIADIALGEQPVRKGQGVLQTILGKETDRHPAPMAEWFKPGEVKSLTEGGEAPVETPSKRDGILRVHAADDVEIRRAVEAVLGDYTKRWGLESDDAGADGLPTLTYEVRLKKRCGPDDLLGALRERLGPKLTEYTPNLSGAAAEVQGTAT